MTKSKHSYHSQEEIYRPPRSRNRGIAEAVCGIMDAEGPRPMKNFRPTQKQQTAAEQFEADHQAAHEAWGRRSRDLAEDVGRHNAAHPTLYDELKKRRSTVKATAAKAQLKDIKEPAARKRRSMSRQGKVQGHKGPKRRRLAPPRCCEHAEAPRHANSHVLKRRPRNKRKANLYVGRLHSFSNLCTNIGCQCLISSRGLDKKSGTADAEFSKATVEEGSSQNKSNTAEGRQRDNSDCPSDTSRHSKTESIPVNPDTEGSMSSYNSFASLDHEPMV